MVQAMLQSMIVFLVFVIITESVKIGISKPVTVTENVTTVAIETTTIEPAKTASPALTTSTQTTKISLSTNNSTTISTTTTTKTPILSTSSTPLAATPSKTESQASSIWNKPNFELGYYCSCDLRAYFCDINCCCDIDCIEEELRSFDCQREENRLEDFNYEQGLPPCRINEGWLCVFRENIETSKDKHNNYVFDVSRFHQWPQLLLEDNNSVNDRNFYKIGDPVLMYNLEANEIFEFELPYSFHGHHCEAYEAVRYLTSIKTSCYISLERARHVEASLFQKLSTSFLLLAPNTEIPLDGIIKETPTEFIPTHIFYCIQGLNCLPVSVNSSYFDILDDSYSYLIQTRLTHNITNIISCKVFFHRADEKAEEIWLTYAVNFIQINETEGITLEVSGPLGYNVGSPLIIGQKVLINESADSVDPNRMLSYFHPNRTQEIHIHIPRTRRNQCEDSQLTVNFGESILVQCSVELDNSTELTSDTNFTKICEDLQDRSFKHLQVRNIQRLPEDFLISILGYPTNKTDYWTKIEVRSYENLPTIGVYLSKEDSFICQNMILNLKYEFLTMKDVVNGIRHQNLLKSATIEMGKRHDLQFRLDETVSIPLTFSTLFYDLQEVNKSSNISNFCLNSLIRLFIFFYFMKKYI